MTETPTTSWRDTRAKRKPDEDAVAAHRETFLQQERSYVLRELREEQGLTQRELAERLHLTQPTVSALEGGDLDRSALATLRSYVNALGGSLEVTADFGGRRFVISTDH